MTLARKRFFLLLATTGVLAAVLLGINWTPIKLRYHYSIMKSTRRAELETKGVMGEARRNQMHWAYVRHRDYLVRAGYKIEEKQIATQNIGGKPLFAAVGQRFPGLDFEMPAVGGRWNHVVVYASPEVTKAVESFIKELDVKSAQAQNP
jgi:hypothetical protein